MKFERERGLVTRFIDLHGWLGKHVSKAAGGLACGHFDGLTGR